MSNKKNPNKLLAAQRSQTSRYERQHAAHAQRIINIISNGKSVRPSVCQYCVEAVIKLLTHSLIAAPDQRGP